MDNTEIQNSLAEFGTKFDSFAEQIRESEETLDEYKRHIRELSSMFEKNKDALKKNSDELYKMRRTMEDIKKAVK